MQVRNLSLLAGVLLAGASFTVSTQANAQALSPKDCGAKYQAAKAANTLNGQNYNAFRKVECAAPGAAAAAPAAVTPAAAPANPLRPAAVAPAAAPAAAAAAGSAVLPKAIDAKYSTISAGKGREKTCLDQYNANKATNGNGGLKWIEKGGGYYSVCNKALKS